MDRPSDVPPRSPTARIVAYDNTFTSKIPFTYTLDGTSYTSDGGPRQMLVPNGSGTLSYRFSGTQATCGTTWHGEALTAQGTLPNITATELWLYAADIDVTLGYFVQIRTEP
jgi:hypothetical protein